MVGVGGGEVVLRITGVQKTIKGEGENLACGHHLIHRGEEGTKSGYKKTKRGIKILACGHGLSTTYHLTQVKIASLLFLEIVYYLGTNLSNFEKFVILNFD
jgi:hypothetical protein